MKYLEQLPWIYGALVMVALFVIYTIAILVLVRIRVDQQDLKANHDVAGVVFANVGVLYAVLLGFTVVNVQQRFDKIRESVHVEASYLAQLYRDAEVFSDNDKQTIRTAIKKYGDIVINEEWNSKTNEEMISHRAVHALTDVWNAYYDIDLTTSKQNIWYSESISKLNQLISARISRLLGSQESLGPEIWTFLIIGGLVLMAFICFFGLESLTSHILMAIILSASTAFLLYVIYSLDTAFSGENSISSAALSKVLESFN